MFDQSPPARTQILPNGRKASVLVIALVVLIAGCGSARPTTPATSPTAAADRTTVVVQLTDSLRIEPATVRVPVRMPVTFVVRNTGTTDHEFFVGDEGTQVAHEADMAGMGGMMHDEANGIAVAAGATKSLTMAFSTAGSTVAGVMSPATMARE